MTPSTNSFFENASSVASAAALRGDQTQSAPLSPHRRLGDVVAGEHHDDCLKSNRNATTLSPTMSSFVPAARNGETESIAHRFSLPANVTASAATTADDGRRAGVARAALAERTRALNTFQDRPRTPREDETATRPAQIEICRCRVFAVRGSWATTPSRRTIGRRIEVMVRAVELGAADRIDEPIPACTPMEGCPCATKSVSCAMASASRLPRSIADVISFARSPLRALSGRTGAGLLTVAVPKMRYPHRPLRRSSPKR